jgi:hypothetical protein
MPRGACPHLRREWLLVPGGGFARVCRSPVCRRGARPDRAYVGRGGASTRAARKLVCMFAIRRHLSQPLSVGTTPGHRRITRAGDARRGEPVVRAHDAAGPDVRPDRTH